MKITRNKVGPDVHAKRQLILLAKKMYGLEHKEAVQYVAEAYKELDSNEPVTIEFNLKDKEGDLYPHSTPIEEYLGNCLKEDTCMVPSWSTYSKDTSIPAPEPEIVEENMVNRGIQKAKAFAALMVKNMLEYAMQFTMQINSKTVSNALSGAVSVGGTCIQNPSSHTTSTSTARAATSTPNSSIERFLTGLMHFKDPNSVLGYLAEVVTSVQDPEIIAKYEKVMKQYNLIQPTVEDIALMIEDSTKDYWVHSEHTALILAFIKQLSDIEKAVVYYNGSLYNLHKLNPVLIKEWLEKLGKIYVGVPSDGDYDTVKGIDSVVMNTISHLFNAELKGVTIPLKEYDPQLLANMAATYTEYNKNIEAFHGIIDMFFRVTVLAPNMGDYKEMVRDSVIVNDTDSGIFHIGTWIEILMGHSHIVNDQSRRYCGVFSDLTSMVFIQAMDILTLNMNVHNHERRNIYMKSEFTFSILALPSASKHYFAEVSIVEGNVLPVPKLEQKGVGLRNAATPNIVRTIAMDMEKDISHSIKEYGYVDHEKYLGIIHALEGVVEQGAKTSADYYHTVDIKSEDAQNAIWQKLWNDTKLGRDNKVTIPCGMIKIPTTLTNKTNMKAWLDSIEDTEIAEGISEWLRANGKTTMPRLYLPKEGVVAHGIPDYIVEIISTREVVLGITKMLYIILETMGILKDSKRTLSEVYTPGLPYPYLNNKGKTNDTLRT